MADVVTMVLGGIGGYGECYLKDIFKDGERHDLKVIAAFDPFAEKSKYFSELQNRNIPIYKSLEQCLDVHKPMLVVLATPIGQHCPQTCLALSRGSHVLCEKPVAATIQEVHKMIK